MGVNVKLSGGLLKNHLELLRGLENPLYALVLTGVIITLLKKSRLKYIFFVVICVAYYFFLVKRTFCGQVLGDGEEQKLLRLLTFGLQGYIKLL